MKKGEYKIRSLNLILVVLLLVGVSSSVFAAWNTNNQAGANTQIWGNGIQCSTQVNAASWVNITGVTGSYSSVLLSVVFNASGAVGNCSKYVNSTEGRGSCCPTGYTCNLVTSRCDLPTVDYCEQFTTNKTCSDSNLVTFPDLNPAELFFQASTEWSVYGSKCNATARYYINGSGVICSDMSRCLCSWSNGCSSNTLDLRQCGSNPPVVVGQCAYNLVETKVECDTIGKVTRIYNVTATPSSYVSNCIAPTNRVSSCSAVAIVPFFSYTNVLFVLFGIIGVYFLLGVRSKAK